jgi:ABC-type glycerol-3-phosphate transport system permease component
VLIPLILSNSTTSTLTMYAASFTTTYEVDYAGLAATGIFTSIPSIILVIMFNKQLIEGLIEGAVKG